MRSSMAAALFCLLVVPSRAGAQVPPGERPEVRPLAGTQVVVAEGESARETRQRLFNLLRQYPPTLGEVLRLDPSLLSSESYLQPYPALAAFLAQHPEVLRNPAYFVGGWQFDQDAVERAPELRSIAMVEGLFTSAMVLSGVVTAFGLLAWVIKMAIDHRRWLRATRVQTEAHTKLLDRFTSNEDLLTYMQTPAGRRFLDAAPVASAPPAVPIARMLWSVQVGTVAALVGAGFLFLSGRFGRETAALAEASPFLYLVGVLVIAAGVGFLASAAISYLLSRRLGLLDPGPPTESANV